MSAYLCMYVRGSVCNPIHAGVYTNTEDASMMSAMLELFDWCMYVWYVCFFPLQYVTLLLWLTTMQLQFCGFLTTHLNTFCKLLYFKIVLFLVFVFFFLILLICNSISSPRLSSPHFHLSTLFPCSCSHIRFRFLFRSVSLIAFRFLAIANRLPKKVCYTFRRSIINYVHASLLVLLPKTRVFL